jgi:hypothetical protein
VPRIPNPFRRESNGYDDPAASHDDDFDRDRFHFLNRRVGVIGGVVLLVLIAFGCWLAYEGVQAKSNLEDARGAAQQAREALLKGNSADTKQWVDQAQSHAKNAHDATHSVPWSLASAVPWLGSPFKTGQQISDVVLGLATDVLLPSADVAQALSPDRLLEGGRVDVQLLRNSAPRLTEISAAAAKLGDQARAISEPAYLSQIRDARTQLQKQTADVTGLLRNTDLAARLVPSMMGADGPRTYFMGFQTNAEARGTGGLLGGFGILRFDNGKGTMDSLGSNAELNKQFAPLDLGPEFQSQYGYANPTTDFRNSNLSSHFPYAAQIWKSLWQQQSGMSVDGAIAIDPVALSYILGAVGPVTMPDGEVITADNVVELTESTVYARFPTDQPARKAYLQDVASEVVKKVTAHIQSPRDLLDALGKAVSEGRIAVWSASPADQALLEQTPLAHVVPEGPGPFASVVINNLGGDKLDYYLRRKIEYAADGCDGQTRKSTITVTLTNTAPAGGLPDYVTSLQGGTSNYPLPVPVGTNVTSVTLLATPGSRLSSAVVDGEKATVFPGVERGHPTYEVQVYVKPGQTLEVKYLLTEPATDGIPVVPVQPLADDAARVVAVPECS